MDTIHSAPENFIQLIRGISEAYRFDCQSERAYLRLLKDCHNLTLEKLNSDIIRVAQYKRLEFEIIPSPEIEFLIEVLEAQKGVQESWIPLRISEGFDFRQVEWTDKSGVLIDADSSGAEEVADLCQLWANSIEQQHWLINQKPASGVIVSFRY